MVESRQRRGGERRTKFGETAVEIIATQGLHALTHRTVDETAGYPPGSINYYAPTRSRLLDGRRDLAPRQRLCLPGAMCSRSHD